jgi:hypothetical protein
MVITSVGNFIYKRKISLNIKQSRLVLAFKNRTQMSGFRMAIAAIMFLPFKNPTGIFLLRWTIL